MPHVALVTGANKGIGKEIARGLARAGLFVLAGARDPDRGRAAAAELAEVGNVTFVGLDVTDRLSIDSAVARVARDFGRLDVLVNNAGVSGGSIVRPSEETGERLRVVYETNVFAVVDMIHAFLPLLSRADAARIVNVSSLRGSLGDEGAWVGQPSMAYSSSKTALNALTMHYARELAGTPIKIFGAAPGHVATDFNGFRGIRTAAQGAAIAVRLATEDGFASGGVFDDERKLPW